MTCVLFAHRDADHFAPKLRERFPALKVVTAPTCRGRGRLGEAT